MENRSMKFLKSLLAAILVIAMVVPNITVFAATSVPYKKTGTVYTVGGKSYYQAQTTSEYNGVAKGTMFWLDANSNVVTKEDTLKKLSQISLFSANGYVDLLISGAESAKSASSGYYSVFCKIANEEELGTLIGKASGVALSLCSGNVYSWGEVAIDVGGEILSAERIKTTALIGILKIHANNADANLKKLDKLTDKAVTDYDSLVAAYTAYAECYASLAAIEFLAGDEVAEYSNDTVWDRIGNYLFNVLDGIADSVIPDIKAVEIASDLSTGALAAIPLTELALSTKSDAVYESKKNEVYYSFMGVSASSTETANKLANNNTTSSPTTTSKYSTGTYKPSEWDGLNMRSGAATSYSKVGAIAAGTNFVVTQINGIWGKTTCNGVTGWVCLDYATKVSSSTTTTPAKKSYEIDVNGHINGNYKTSLDGYVTFDVYINGSCVKNDVGDFCTSYVDGTSYEIKDIKAKNGYKYVSGSSLSGKINGEKIWVYLTLELDSTVIKDSTGFVDFVNNKVGEKFDTDACQAFVCRAVKSFFGKDANACCATKAWQQWKKSSSKDNIPLGAAVYFAGSNVTCSCGQKAGHSAIYVGNNTIVHTWSGEVVSTTIDWVINRGYTYRGWGWQANYEIVQSSNKEEATPEKPDNDSIDIIVIPETKYEKIEPSDNSKLPDGWVEKIPSGEAKENYTSKTFYRYRDKSEQTEYGSWSTNQTTHESISDSDVIKQISSKKHYNYYHYCSQTYEGYNNNVDSIKYGTGGVYHEKVTTAEMPKTSIPDKGGKTMYGGTSSYKCEKGQQIWAKADPFVTYEYSYQTRTKTIKTVYTAWSDWRPSSVATKDGRETESIVLYQYSPEKYTITYNANGGSGAPSSQTKTHGKIIKVSSQKPTHSGYEFDGWATSANGNVEYDPSEKYTKDCDITLYAVWTPLTYKVIYNANGGTGAPASQTKIHNEKLYITEDVPKRDGYSFVGWATTKTDSVSYKAGQQYTSDKDITLYAVWEASTYTISYNANGGTDAPKNQTKRYAESIKLSTQEPTRKDYIFLGWSTSAQGSVEFAPGSVCSVNENTTLYALWQEEENEVYYIIYNANCGKNAPSMQTKNEDEDITISEVVPTREGYTFDGWAIGNDDTVVYSSGDTYKENKTLYLHAVWTANTYTITYDANGGTGVPRNQAKIHDENITLSAVVPEKEDCVFIGWSDDPYAEYAKYYAEDTFSKNSDTVLYAVWEEIIEEDEEDEETNDDKNQSQKEIPFEDVPEDAWYRKDVENAYKNGLINGKSEKRYAPNDNMTYAEAIKLACTIYQLYYDGEVTLTNGSDVWYSTYMDYALENRIVRTDYSSVANEYVTRKEFVNIFYGALPLKEFAKINNVEDNIIPDVKIGDAYSGEIYTFYRAGILTGNDAKGTFKPDSNISRSEVAAIVTRMLDSGARKEVILIK